MGGDEYVQRVREAFAGSRAVILALLEGLKIGQKMSKVRTAIEAGRPLV